MDPSRCIVLVPIGGYLEPECARGLGQLEARGYHVRAVPRYAAIDQGRSQMATDALLDGYDALMWIDSDVGFDADAVDMLREHDEPVVCGIYPRKGRRELACNLLPGTPKVIFGEGGGLMEIRYAAMGFCYTQRKVYDTMIVHEQLPICNKQFDRITVPYFLPLLQPDGPDDHWYMNAEYSFCERARRSGFKVMADTRIRLGHIGRHSYYWEEAGTDKHRYATYEFNIT
ncbi:hypothetical protein KO481_38670 [Nocardia sp. NEAU-G5]|uniref:Glycosyltransferase n=1 Tax=Nocardia albiluteola TaxID=2842303 RepID=A0ABS6BDD2_9NOCA|nr:hypothetical protein [Nocardia albiluteola]MBU3067435.1 hypothetical protein [Nocardia albiluteola]